MTLEYQVLSALADGSFRSGNALAVELGVSRTAIWKYVQSLLDKGVDIFSVPGKGYRLDMPIELLDQGLINQHVGSEQQLLLSQLDVCYSVDSTNTQLRELAIQGADSGHVCFAEHQTHGRGRRGRQWVSPFGRNLYFSFLWRFSGVPHSLGGLSLAMAVGVARALREIGLEGVQVKWPNDLQYQGRKLAGILLEMSGDPTANCHIITGVGVNVGMPAASADKIDQPWIDVSRACGKQVSRNQLAGRLLHHILVVMEAYPKTGLQPLMAEWQQMNAMADQEVELHTPTGIICGIMAGIDEDGALLLKQSDGTQKIHSGEVSLRPVKTDKE
jgi:BirA family biotin operon repressor/biotin-[acetyl-CoA-carboxylase] ligase